MTFLRAFTVVLTVGLFVLATSGCDHGDECEAGQVRCDGDVAVTCVSDKDDNSSCGKEGGCAWPSTRIWRKESCGARKCAVAKGHASCVLTGEPEPRCDSVDSFCEGSTEITCAYGLATSRSDGWLRSSAPQAKRDPLGVTILTLGESLPLSTHRTSRCGSRDLTATASYASSAPAVVSVDARGVLHAESPGRAVITASDPTEHDTVEVRVVWRCADGLDPASPQYINVAPDASLRVGETAALAATAEWFPESCNADVSASAAWTADDESVARVDSRGVVTAVARGHTMVRATWRGAGENSGSNVIVRD